MNKCLVSNRGTFSVRLVYKCFRQSLRDNHFCLLSPHSHVLKVRAKLDTLTGNMGHFLRWVPLTIQKELDGPSSLYLASPMNCSQTKRTPLETLYLIWVIATILKAVKIDKN